MNQAESFQRRAVSIAVVTLSAGALVLIATILSGNEFDDTSARVVASAAALSVFLLIGLAGQSLLVTRQDLAWIGALTMVVTLFGFLLVGLTIWFDWSDGTTYAKPAGVLLAFSIAFGHTSMLLRGVRATDGDVVRLIRVATIGAVFVLATMLTVEIATPHSTQVDPQAIGAVAVLYVLGTILIPLVRRLEEPKLAHGTAAGAAPAPSGKPSSTAVLPSASNRLVDRKGDLSIRPAYASDAEAIAAIYNQGIEERQATFQTRLHDPGELELKTEQLGGQLIVAEHDSRVVGWAGWTGYDDRADYYAGIAECAVYVDPEARRQGVGAELLEGLATEAQKFGAHKLIAKIFTSNESSIALFRRCGFRDVGTHQRHGRLEGEWKDVLVMERSLPDA